MDSVYNLFFVMAMLSLYMMKEKPDFMYVYGVSLGLAFMCKGPHAALIFLIGILYTPMVRRAFTSAKRVIISICLAAVFPAYWLISRYLYDGFELVNSLFVGEVVERVSESKQDLVMPLMDFFRSDISIIFAVSLVVIAT